MIYPAHLSPGPFSLVLLALAAQSALAQTVAQPVRAATVVITGNPLANASGASPTSVLAGEELVLRRGSTLGDTLDGLPGVSATAFGPNASRPVIRGLDGDRIRILNNSVATLDVSSLSYDHAVPLDPLVVTRIEVLRGPAALFYGGSAIGGVVNALDNRIPDDRSRNGLSGAAELRLGGAAQERGGAVTLDFGRAGAFAVHADAFARHTADLNVPRYTPVADGNTLEPATAVRNSASSSSGGAYGGTLFFDGGSIGMAADTYRSRYGVVVEPDIVIKMQRDQWRVAGRLDRGLGQREIKLDAAFTDYVHREIEGDGSVGTTFKSKGGDLRLQARHADLGPLRGVWGLQLEDADFSALGEEAFVPQTRTRLAAAFALEELTWAGGTTSAGLRLEQARVSSDGDADLADNRFGAATQREFLLNSASLSHVKPWGPNWRLSASLSASQRAPTYFELFANGVHAATGVYERGDAAMDKEQGNHLELAAYWKVADNHLRVGVFQTRFSRFIGLNNAGRVVDETGQEVPAGTDGALPLYRFEPVRARLHGVEIDGAKRLLDGAWRLDATARLDLTRGINRDRAEPLPRLPGWRVALGLDASSGPWRAGMELTRVARQARVPEGDSATAGYTLVNLSLVRQFNQGGADAMAFVKLGNATDKLAYNASAIQTIRGLSPVAGRALQVGMRVAF